MLKMISLLLHLDCDMNILTNEGSSIRSSNTLHFKHGQCLLQLVLTHRIEQVIIFIHWYSIEGGFCHPRCNKNPFVWSGHGFL